MGKKKSKKQRSTESKKEEETNPKNKEIIESESSDDDSSDEESDAGVALDGALDENYESTSEEDNGEKKPKKKGIKRKKKAKEEEIQVEFIFCDMDEKFFHGIKTLVASSPLHAGHSSALSDLMIENVQVGTVVSTEGYDEDYVYGFGSILSLHNNENEIIKSLKETFLPYCPNDHKQEMELLLTGEKKTRRLVGLFLHERMLNVPLVITHAIHQQLLMDLEWAVKNDTSFDFGLLVRLAPVYPQKESTVPIYKYFDDDIFASNAEFTYMLPKSFSDNRDDNLSYNVIVLSVTAYKKCIEELANLNTT